MLVVAALYTYNQYHNPDNTCLQVTATTEEEANTSSSQEDSSSSNDSPQSQQSQQQSQSQQHHHRRQSLRRLQRRFSDSFQSARQQTNSLLHTTVGRCVHNPSSEVSTSATRESSSSFFASIPLQGSSSYSLLLQEQPADHRNKEPFTATESKMINDSTTNNNSRNIPVEDVSLNMFPQSVRQEWINAVFGKDFCQKNHQQTLSSQQGIGHAGIASYTSYTTTIPNSMQQSQQQQNGTTALLVSKVGITISRLPLGVYVRRIVPASEAALLGVQVNDVLVSINGMNVLCEPSKPLLERLWQYEGVFVTQRGSSNNEVSITTTTGAAATESSTFNNNNTSSRRHRYNQPDVTGTESNSADVTAAAAAAAAAVAVNSGSNNGNMTDPVVMTFSRHGQLYQVIFLSCGSQQGWGMAWGPCGNFPLVKRSYSLAAAAGVQRGSILACVGGGSSLCQSFRELDHYGMAMALSKEFQAAGGQQDLHLTLCYPPRAARPSRVISSPQSIMNGNTTTTSNNNSNTSSATYNTSTAQQNQAVLSSSYNTSSLSLSRKKRTAPQPKRVLRMDDGVEVKFHSLEFAIGGICSAAVAAGNYSSPSRGGRGGGGGGGGSGSGSSISDLAEQVAAGAVESPFVKDIVMPLSSGGQQVLHYSPCPTLQGKELLDAWNPMESLMYCCAFYKTGYQEDALQDFLNDYPVLVHHQQDKSKTSSPTIAALHALMNTPHAASMASAFLLQFISVICFPSSEIVTRTMTPTATSSPAVEEKKSDDLHLVQDNESSETVNRNTNHHDQNQNDAKELTSMLLKLSRRDEGFCQRLYFSLRSYISSIEKTTTTAGASNNNKNGSSLTHLMALLNCLEMLRFAEKQLPNINNKKVPIHSSSPAPPAISKTSTTTTTSKTSTMESPIPNAVPASPASSASLEEPTVAVNKKKSVLHFLRKKKPSTTTKMHPSSKSKISMVSPLGDQAGQEMPLRQAPILGNTTATVVTPTLSQQQQQYGMSSIMSADIASSLSQSPSVMYENMSDFLSQLDQICSTIERSLQRSFRQKIADWAMQPWSASKDSALASVTSVMRQSLKHAKSNNNSDSQRVKLLVNPVESSELLSSVDSDECYILPSAHFPILLTFNVSERRRSCDYSLVGEERIYRTTVRLGGLSSGSQKPKSGSYTVHAAVAGKILASDESRSNDNTAAKHEWRSGNTLVFDTRSSWGAPQTLSLRLSSSILANPTDTAPVEDATFGWIDLSRLWKECTNSGPGSSSKSVKCQVNMLSLKARDEMFDEHGESSYPEQEEQQQQQATRIELELEVSTEFVDFGDASNGDFSRKRMLLYKHDDDLRQEDFAVQFIRTCDNILKASGLDMKLLTFQCIPVGTRRGFVEWIPGSVPLSEVCQPFLDSFLESSDNKATASDDDRNSSPSMFAKAGLTKYESLFRLGGSLQGESFRRLAGAATAAAFEKPGSSFADNSVQDYLRSVAYDEDAPYLIRRDIMDTYVKSCAGYSVITYILGVGDRHLDNLLLHQSGSFFHCDYSFILGSDPKKYLPMRITEDMVNGMGGRSSDNYAKFLSLTSAAFLALRRPEIVRILLSMVRLTECSNLPDMSENQTLDQAILGMRDRLRLDLREDEAVAFMENLIEDSLNSKLWLAVDAIHSLGKKF